MNTKDREFYQKCEYWNRRPLKRLVKDNFYIVVNIDTGDYAFCSRNEADCFKWLNKQRKLKRYKILRCTLKED